ncbi:hypothetical protein [Natrinema hispanicum]|nr:hypothetical protein [Natrinema hispanicum]
MSDLAGIREDDEPGELINWDDHGKPLSECSSGRGQGGKDVKTS